MTILWYIICSSVCRCWLNGIIIQRLTPTLTTLSSESQPSAGLFLISKCSLSQPTSSSPPLHFASPVHASIHIYRLQRLFASSLTNADSNSKGSPTLTHWVFVIVWMHLYIIYHLNNHLNTQILANIAFTINTVLIEILMHPSRDSYLFTLANQWWGRRGCVGEGKWELHNLGAQS